MKKMGHGFYLQLLVLAVLAVVAFPMSVCAQKKQTTKIKVDAKKDTLTVLTEKATAGDAVAQNTLASWYYNGKNVQQNYETAVKWWSKSADQGNVYAIGNLAMCHQLGKGIKKDSVLAIKLYKTAIKNGNNDLVVQHAKLAEKKENAFSNFLMYELYNNGIGVKRDAVKAASYMEHLAEIGDVDSQYRLALYYLNNNQADKAVRWFRTAAQNGNVGAIYYYGMLLHSGMGVAQDKEKGLRMMQKAEEKGFIAADNQLGRIYYEGDGVEMDFAKAVNYLKKAAPTTGKAQWLLGLCYLKGQGVTKDYYLATQWMVESAFAYEKEFNALLGDESESAFSQYLMGLKHYYIEKNFDAAIACFKKVEKAKIAEGITMQALCFANKNYAKNNAKKAFKLLTKASEKSAVASYYLSCLFEDGNGTKKDTEKALDLLKKAADAGIAPAQCKLGDKYFEGMNVTKEYTKAAQLYLAAERQHHLSSASAKRLAQCYMKHISVLPDLNQAEKRVKQLQSKVDNDKLITLLKKISK